MNAVRPARAVSRRAWTLLIPEALLVAFIVWYLSGLDGLASLATGTSRRPAGAGQLGRRGRPSCRAFRWPTCSCSMALIALAITAAYHLSILSAWAIASDAPRLPARTPPSVSEAPDQPSEVATHRRMERRWVWPILIAAPGR